VSKKKHFHTGDFQLAAASKAFLLCSWRGVVLSHPEIFEFQVVNKIKNKTTFFS
jgi:hypothetical protein